MTRLFSWHKVIYFWNAKQAEKISPRPGRAEDVRRTAQRRRTGPGDFPDFSRRRETGCFLAARKEKEVRLIAISIVVLSGAILFGAGATSHSEEAQGLGGLMLFVGCILFVVELIRSWLGKG